MLKVHFINFFFLLKHVFWTSHILTLWAPVSREKGPQGSGPGQARSAGRGGSGQAAGRRPGLGLRSAGETWWWRCRWRWREPELPHLCPQHSWFLSGSAWQKQTQRGRRGLTRACTGGGHGKGPGSRKKTGSGTEGPSRPPPSTHWHLHSARLPGRHGTGRGPLGLPAGGSVLQQPHRWALCRTAVSALPTEPPGSRRPADRASRQLRACRVVGCTALFREDKEMLTTADPGPADRSEDGVPCAGPYRGASLLGERDSRPACDSLAKTGGPATCTTPSLGGDPPGPRCRCPRPGAALPSESSLALVQLEAELGFSGSQHLEGRGGQREQRGLWLQGSQWLVCGRGCTRSCEQRPQRLAQRQRRTPPGPASQWAPMAAPPPAGAQCLPQGPEPAWHPSRQVIP